MSGINTSIKIHDFATQNINNINDALNKTIGSFEQLDQVLNEPMNTAGLDGIVTDINKVRDELSKGFGTGSMGEVGGIDTPKVEPIRVPLQIDEPVIPDIPTPEPIPVTWDVQEVEVFSGGGTERFNQEINDVNSRMQTLNETQRQIGRTAAGMDIIPDSAYKDIQGMSVRIEDIKKQINDIAADPINLNVDSANRELETLRQTLGKAESQQMDLNAAMQRMDGTAITKAYNNLNRTVSQTERNIRDNAMAQQNFTEEVTKTDNASNALRSTIMKVAGVAAAAFSARSIINLSDSITQTTARLDLMNDNQQTTAELNDLIFESANRSRGSYLDTADAVASLGGNAKDAFENTKEIVHFSELLNKQFTIAGTSQEGMSAATLQLTQAMGMGVLRGEELNSILEQAPNIVQSIAEYMEVPTGAIKEMASEGQITADIVKYAMFNAADDINAKFESMPMTFAQIGQQIQNYAIQSFQPILQQLNDFANSDFFQSVVQGAINWLAILGQVAINVINGMISVGEWLSSIWSMISPIIYGVATAMLFYMAIVGAYNVIMAISAGLEAASAFSKTVQAAASMMQAGATFAATAAQHGLNAALLASPITWVILGIIAIIAVIYAAVAAVNHFAGTSISATGIIAGVFMTLATAIFNIVAYLWNIFASIAEFFVNVWQHPIYSVKKLFGSLANNVLDIAISISGSFDSVATNIANAFVGAANMAIGAINWIIKALNTLPGIEIGEIGNMKATSSITGTLEGLKGNVNDWVGEAPDGYWEAPKMNITPLSEGFNKGYEWGQGVDEKVSNFSLTDSIMDFLNMDPNGAGAGAGLQEGLFDANIPGIDELNPGASGKGGTPKAVKGIADDVGKISDNLETSVEDLKYMIDLASRQVINRHTIHNDFKFDMSGANYNVENEQDLDGIVDSIAKGLKDAMEISVEGV